MIEKPKKERRFLKTLGKIGEILLQEVLLKVGSNLVKRIGGKKTLPSILFLFISISLFAQYPATGNKQRLGFQTTADGLVWRGSISDTSAIQPTSNQNAWLVIDTINLKIYSFDFTSNVWNLVSGGTSGLTMPFDSITFNTAKDGTVGVGEVEYNDTQGSLIQGLKGGLVTNVIGQQLHQRVNNRTGSTLAKGTAVYLSGSQGNRITVAKALATSDPTSANTFGIVAESIADNQSGYVITEGLIRNINTSALVEDSAVYLSPTVAGALTSTKPQAPQHNVYIGVCVKSNAGSGELFVSIKNGLEITELHDVRITSPVDKASLYYKSSEGLWRDTTATLLVSDTASMLINYALKSYADTSGRFYARQDFTNVTSSTLTWTQIDTLVVGGTGVVQVYRNGQILLPTQYTIPTKTTVVIGATAYKLGENYTVIFPRGGGASGSGGSGSLTSISGGTGITVSPNPITTTGTVSADLSVLMELTDTTLLNLTSRFATKLNISDTASMLSNYNSRINLKLNISDTASMLSPYFRDADTSLLNLTSRFALKLNSLDTASLSNRINAKGNGTVTSIGSGFGLLGGTITTSGTLRLDSAVVFTRIRDSIVDVAIGTDTIKILKQEYSPATTSVLTWTITSKFPIQLKSYILVFRNGQLLNNDQFNLTDTNKITIVSTSFKLGANYTVATVSGIGSVGSAQGDPVYPEAGIAVSTGTTWTTSIVNNSNSWNIAFNDKINNAVFSGTDTKTLTLSQYDGGTFTPTFTDLQGVTGVTAGTGLTGGTISTTGTLAVDFDVVAPLASPTFTGTVGGITKSMVALGNVDNTSDANKPVSTATQTALNLKQNTLTNPVTGTGTTNNLSLFTGTSTLGNSVIQESSGNIGIGVTPIANLTFDVAKNILLKSGSTGIASVLFSETGTPSSTDVEFGGIIRYNGSLDRMELVTRDNIGSSNVTNTGLTMDRITGNIGLLKPTTVSSTLSVTGAATLSSTLVVTGNITEGGNNVLNNLDTVNLSNRINTKVGLSGDETITGTKTFTTGITTANLRLSNTISGTNNLLGLNSSGGAVGQVTVGSGLNLTSDVLTATNPTEKYYFNLGILAGAADNSNATYDFTYGSNVFIVPTSLNGYCIDSVYIRAVGCSTCPPVVGDKDYYVGVYKASAGNRITTSGATLVGSQITMNEYDLNEVNRNDTLTTGDVWWVYLNGTYTSDMAYITAGFLVKKTCN
jgi:hypothetical protein